MLLLKKLPVSFFFLFASFSLVFFHCLLHLQRLQFSTFPKGKKFPFLSRDTS